jgi:hypothetical protein
MAAIGNLSTYWPIFANQFGADMVIRDGGSCRIELRPNEAFDPELVGPQEATEQQKRTVKTLAYHFQVPRYLTDPGNSAWTGFINQPEIEEPTIAVPSQPIAGDPITRRQARIERYAGTWRVEQISWDDDPGGELTTVSVQLKQEGEWEDYAGA